jgi:hypothetical protein
MEKISGVVGGDETGGATAVRIHKHEINVSNGFYRPQSDR